MKLKFTKDLPTKEGYYWWTNFGEHTPTVLEVREDADGTLWGGNGEFTVVIEKKPEQLELIDEDEDDYEPEEGFKYGDELWCYIPSPCLPNGKQVEPNCY